MFVIVYREGGSDTHYVCTAQGTRQFHTSDVSPALYANVPNAMKVVHKWMAEDVARTWKNQGVGYRHYINIFDAKDKQIKTIRKIDYKYIEIVPVIQTLDFNNAKSVVDT